MVVILEKYRNENQGGSIHMSEREALKLAADLLRAVDEARDHQSMFPVTMVMELRKQRPPSQLELVVHPDLQATLDTQAEIV